MLFPVLMVLMVWRTILVRVRPNALLVFRLNAAENASESQVAELPEDESRQRLTSMEADGGEGATPPEMLEAIPAVGSEEEDEEAAAANGGPGERRGLWQKVACVQNWCL